MDISPVETTSSSAFPTYIAAMKAIEIPDEVSRSYARKLADEQLSLVIQVMPPAPQMVLVGICQGKNGHPRCHRELPQLHPL